jgi:hypothetical protein
MGLAPCINALGSIVDGLGASGSETGLVDLIKP